MADLRLPDTVNAPEALLQSVGIPGQVVVDHQVRPLQVDAFASRICRYQHQRLRIVQKLLLRGAPLLASYAAMDVDYGLWTSQQGADAFGQVVQRVTVLGENYQLAPRTGGLEHLGVVLQQCGQLLPLAIGAAQAHSLGQRFEPGQDGDLGLQLTDGAGCGGLVHHLLFEVLHLRVRRVVQVF